MRVRAIIIPAIFIALASVLSDCKPRPEGESGQPGTTAAGGKSLRVLCSFLPIWAFTRNVVGERPGIEVDVLIPGSQGPHDYQLTPADMRKINDADLFIVNGFRLEEFLSDAAKKARPGLKIVEAAEKVEPIIVAGKFAPYPQVGPTPDPTASAEKPHAPEYEGLNPHPFASPRDAAVMVRRIAEALAELDPPGAPTYRQNAEAYAAKLEKLADDFKAVVAAAPNKKIVTFHNAFDYLARDCGLEIVGVVETTPGQEPSAGELNDLVKTIKSSGAAAVFFEPQFSPRLAQVLAEETGAPLFELDPTHTGEMKPDYYEQAMRKNLETLKKALGRKSSQ